MKIVIDIPEEKWKITQKQMYCNIFDLNMWYAIKNGTPLPKNHGRLIDADALIKESLCVALCLQEECDDCQYKCVSKYDITHAETIIEADKEE